MTTLNLPTENPYEPPKSELVSKTEQDFYVVSRRKFWIMYFATAGIFPFYWTYRNWRQYQLASHDSVIPFLRAWFFIFFFHSLFRRVQQKLDAEKIAYSWSPRTLATTFVAIILASSVMENLATRSIVPSFFAFTSILMMAPLSVLYLKAQDAINHACGDPDAKSNSTLTGANFFWMLIGLLLWGFVAYSHVVRP